MKSRLKLIALIAASVMLCENSHGGFAPLAKIGTVSGDESDVKGELDDGTQTEARGCEDYNDPNCPTPAAAEPAPAEESAAPSDEAEPEAEAAPEATGDDSDSSEPEDSSDAQDVEDPEDADDADDESEDDEDFGDDE